MMDFVSSDHKPLLVIFSEMIGDMQMVPQEDTQIGIMLTQLA